MINDSDKCVTCEQRGMPLWDENATARACQRCGVIEERSSEPLCVEATITARLIERIEKQHLIEKAARLKEAGQALRRRFVCPRDEGKYERSSDAR